ncbi:MAG: xanthine dehydrogenase [Pseudomonadota bacterium]|jgi:xanthine dehydrogenase accessory factor
MSLAVNSHRPFRFTGRGGRAYAVILGANEVASALAVELRRAGWSVVLTEDPTQPVLRRGMAFYDALFGDPTALAGVRVARADTTAEILAAMDGDPDVVITAIGLLDLIVLGRIDQLVDARRQPGGALPDLRWLARVTVGLGDGYVAGVNCDIAIGEDAAPPSAADHHARRMIAAASAGVWRTPLDIGAHVFRGLALGKLDQASILAPLDGMLIGLVRDGTPVSAGARLVEIDQRIRQAKWSGLDNRGKAFARATLKAIREHDARRSQTAKIAPSE